MFYKNVTTKLVVLTLREVQLLATTNHGSRHLTNRRTKINWPRWALQCVFTTFAILTIASLLAAQESAWPQPYFATSNVPLDDNFIPPMTPLKSIFEGFEEHRERFWAGQAGANAHERSVWGTINFPVTDPKEYSRIESLDNDDPSSFWYTQRPNLFGIAIPDEWDFTNLINTDRSDFTDTPVSVGKGGTILETGLTYTRVLSADTHSNLRTLPESLLRVGITNEFELRFKFVGFSMLDQKDLKTGQSGSIFGTNDLQVGFKYEIFQQRNWFPMTTLVAGALLPSGTNGISGNSVQPQFNIVNGWAIRRYLFLKHQFGMDHLTQPSFSVAGPGPSSGPFGLVGTRPTVDSFHSSVSCLYQATKHIGGFVEWITLYGHNQPTTNIFDTGTFFYLTPNVQLDCTIGSSVGSPDSTFYTKAGFSTRW